ncbi:major facilitator superfamily domain-containing protein, partial [Chytriomyces sp. MP71]
QNVYHFSTVLTAVHLIPMMVVGFLTASAMGYLVTRYPRPLPFLLFGHASMIAACVLFAFVNANVSYWALAFPALCCIVLGFDVIFNLFNILMMTSCAVEHRGFAGGVLNTVVQLGAGIGIAVEYTVADAVTGAQGTEAVVLDALTKGYDTTFWIGVGTLGLSALIAVVFQKLWKIQVEVSEAETLTGWEELELGKSAVAGDMTETEVGEILIAK